MSLWKKKVLYKKSRATPFLIGLFSGFLQGTGLSGSDLRNNYLYSRGFSLSNVQGTTAVLGAINFFLSTVTRFIWGGLKIPDLSPILFLAPFMVLAALGGRFVVKKIEHKWGDIIAVSVMCATLIFIFYKLLLIIR